MICSISGGLDRILQVLAQPDVGNDLSAYVSVLAIGPRYVFARQLDAFERVASGSTNQALPTATRSPSIMAMVSGRRSVTQRSSPRFARHLHVAAQAFHALPDHVHAHAAEETPVIFGAVEQPG